MLVMISRLLLSARSPEGPHFVGPRFEAAGDEKDSIFLIDSASFVSKRRRLLTCCAMESRSGLGRLSMWPFFAGGSSALGGIVAHEVALACVVEGQLFASAGKHSLHSQRLDFWSC
jgi:hypothetical protein